MTNLKKDVFMVMQTQGANSTREKIQDGPTAHLNNFTLYNYTFDKGRLKSLVSWSLKTYGEAKTIHLLENLKKTGFEYATKAGISLGVEDLKIPPKKALLLYEAEEISNNARIQYERSEITGVERFQRLIDTWHKTSEQLKQEVVDYFEKTDVLNPVYMMAFSGARGNISQVRQLVGMRGLMSDPKGQIIDYPIRSNFREGLTITEYIISSYGARKGIVDTALRTANAGYLTRRLVDVAQHVVIANYDCGTKKGVFLSDIKEGNKTIFSLQTRLLGRVLGRDLYKPNTTTAQDGPTAHLKNKNSQPIKIGSRNQEISVSLASEIPKYYNKVFVRSALTCETKKLICQLCYGWSLAQGNLVSIGEAVGIVAAQSIGEPGTQLTMRTFHTGGVFSGDISDQIRAPYNGFIQYSSKIAGTLTRTSEGKIVFLTKVDGFISVVKNWGENTSNWSSEIKQETPKQYKIPAYTLLYFKSGDAVLEKQVIAQISTIARQANMRDDASLIVKSPLQGQLVLQDLLIEESLKGPTYKQSEDSKMDHSRDELLQVSYDSNSYSLSSEPSLVSNLESDLESTEQEYNPILAEKTLSAWNWGYAWVLSCNQYKLPIFSHNNNVQLIPHAGDFVNTSSVMAKVNWFLPKHGGLKTYIEGAFKSDLPITNQLSSVTKTNNKNSFSDGRGAANIRDNLNTQKAAQAWPIHKLLKSNLSDSGSIYGSPAALGASRGWNARQPNYKFISAWLNSKSTNLLNKTNSFLFNHVKIQKNLFTVDIKNIHFNEIGYFLDVNKTSTTKSKPGSNNVVLFLPTNLQSKNLNTLKGNSSFRFSNNGLFSLSENLVVESSSARKQGQSGTMNTASTQNSNFKNSKISNSNRSQINQSYDYGIIAFVGNSLQSQPLKYAGDVRVKSTYMGRYAAHKHKTNFSEGADRTQDLDQNTRSKIFGQDGPTAHLNLTKYLSLILDQRTISRPEVKNENAFLFYTPCQKNKNTFLKFQTTSIGLASKFSQIVGTRESREPNVQPVLPLVDIQQKNTNYYQTYWIGLSTKFKIIGDFGRTTAAYSGATSQTIYPSSTSQDGPTARLKQNISALEASGKIFSKQSKNSRISNGLSSDSIKKICFIPFIADFESVQMFNSNDASLSSVASKSNLPNPLLNKGYPSRNSFDMTMYKIFHISNLKHLQSLKIYKKFCGQLHLSSSNFQNFKHGPGQKVPKHFVKTHFKPSKSEFDLVYKTIVNFSKPTSKRKSILTNKLISGTVDPSGWNDFQHVLPGHVAAHKLKIVLSSKGPGGPLITSYLKTKSENITNVPTSNSDFSNLRGLGPVSKDRYPAQLNEANNKWFINTNPRFLPNYDQTKNGTGSLKNPQTYICIETLGVQDYKIFSNLSNGDFGRDLDGSSTRLKNCYQSRLLIQKPTSKKARNLGSIFSTDAENNDSLFTEIKSLDQYFNLFTSRDRDIYLTLPLKAKGLSCYYKHNKLNDTILSIRKSINLNLRRSNSLKNSWMTWYKVKTSMVFGKQVSSVNPISKVPNLTLLGHEKLSKSQNLTTYFLTHGNDSMSHTINSSENTSKSPGTKASKLFENLAQNSWGNEPIFKLNYASHSSLIKQIYRSSRNTIKTSSNSRFINLETYPELQEKVKTFFDLWKDGLTNYLVKPVLEQNNSKNMVYGPLRGPLTETRYNSHDLIDKLTISHGKNSIDSGAFTNYVTHAVDPKPLIAPLKKKNSSSFIGKLIVPFSKSAILGFYNQPCFSYTLVFKYKNYKLGFNPTFKVSSTLPHGTLGNLKDRKNSQDGPTAHLKPLFKTEYNVSFDNLNTIVSALASTSFLSNYSGEVLGNMNKSRYNLRNDTLVSSTVQRFSKDEGILGTDNPIWYQTKQRIKKNQNRSLVLTTKDLVGYQIPNLNNLAHSKTGENKFETILQNTNYKELQTKWFNSLSTSASCGPLRGTPPAYLSGPNNDYPKLLSKSQTLDTNNINDRGVVHRGQTVSKHNIIPEVGSFILKGDYGVEIKDIDFKLTQNQYFTTSGQIVAINNKRFVLRKAQPIFISARTTFHYFHGDFVINNEPVVTLIYQKLKTGDIIQGIPKVEQFFEARTTKRGRLFRENLPNLLKGLFLKYYFNSFKFLKQAGSTLKSKNNLEWNPKSKDYVMSAAYHSAEQGSRLQTQGNKITPEMPQARKKNQTLVSTSRSSNYTHLAIQWAVKQSFYKIQQIAVDGVLRVYRSQGVSISDKHLEIIVKQMTTKVRIIRGGQTGFFPGELVDLDFVQTLNNVLIKKVLYEPVILGITRASLQVDSFLSAASFQQTAKILSQSALVNKKDFLKGVKENVIVGNLIPTGTGYLVSLF